MNLGEEGCVFSCMYNFQRGLKNHKIFPPLRRVLVTEIETSGPINHIFTSIKKSCYIHDFLESRQLINDECADEQTTDGKNIFHCCRDINVHDSREMKPLGSLIISIFTIFPLSQKLWLVPGFSRDFCSDPIIGLRVRPATHITPI